MKKLAIVLALLVFPSLATAKKFRMPKTTKQLVLVVTPSWTSTDGYLARYERGDKGPWKKVGEPVPVTIGKGGLGWGYGLHPDDFAMEHPGPLKGEGDGRAPAGIFKLGGLWGYADKPPAGATLPYTPSTAKTFCVDDPKSKLYNQIVEQPDGEKPWHTAEAMRRSDGAYTWVVRVEHNAKPIVAGQGSCIFLHAHPSAAAEPTTGCTAMAMKDLEELVKWLAADAQPLLVQVPKDEATALVDEWKLPKP
jgi:D-alanyl-D-alanine dipeptidase